MRIVILTLLVVLYNAGYCSNTDSLINALPLSNNKDKLPIYNELCQSYVATNLDSAKYFAKQQLALSKDMKNKEYESIAYKWLGTIDNFKGNFKQAKLYYDSALVIAKINKVQKQIGTITSNIGTIYEAIGELDSALQFYTSAYQFDSALNYKSGMNNSVPNIGNIYLKKGIYPEAIMYFKEALKLATELNDDFGLLGAYNNLGLAHYRISDYSEASEYYLKGLRITEKINSPYYSTFMLNNLGSLNNDWGNEEMALQYFQKSKRISEESSNMQMTIYANQNIGHIFTNYKQVDSALLYLNKALADAKSINDKYILPSIYANIGTAYQTEGNFEKAKNYFHEAYNLRKNLELKDDLAVSLYLIGYNEFLIGNYSQAKKMALKCNRQAIDNRTKIDNYLLLASIAEKQANNQLALSYYKQYTKLKDSIFDNDKHKQIQNLQTQYETEKKELKIKELKDKTERQQLKQQKTFLLGGLVGVILILIFTASIFIINQRKLRAENKTISTEQKLLRLQMNPHFIFNALAAIQNYIINNDALKAGSYLSNFAKLMRSILSNSKNEFITLDIEIDTLNKYIELQTLRFKDNFISEINIAEDIDIEELLVPPMIAQPFVENSIEHGLLKKEEKGGLIQVNYKKSQINLLIEIIDNGIGRKAADDSKNADHISYATQITNDRLKHLGKQFENSKTEFVDLYKNEKPAGTKVLISLPLIYI